MKEAANKWIKESAVLLRKEILFRLKENIETKVITEFEALVDQHWLLSPPTALWIENHLSLLDRTWDSLCSHFPDDDNIILPLFRFDSSLLFSNSTLILIITSSHRQQSQTKIKRIKELSVMLKAPAPSLKQLKMDLYLSLEGAKTAVVEDFGLRNLSIRKVEGFLKLRSDVNDSDRR